MILVDEIIQWDTPIRCFKDGSCHLNATESLDELHEFARRLGMRRQWFQSSARLPTLYHCHYDLTPSRRLAALQLGALSVNTRIQARAARNTRDAADRDRAYHDELLRLIQEQNHV